MIAGRVKYSKVRHVAFGNASGNITRAAAVSKSRAVTTAGTGPKSIESTGVINIAPPKPVVPRTSPATVTMPMAASSILSIRSEPLKRLRCQDSAVDRNDSTGDEACAIGGEKYGEISNIGHAGETPERYPFQDFPSRILSKRGVGHRRVGNGGCDGIDRDGVGTELPCKAHRQGNDTGLGYSVKRISNRTSTAHSRHRCNVDDAAIALLTHE